MITEFEWRQAELRREARWRRCQTAIVFGGAIAMGSVAVWFQVTDFTISGAQACALVVWFAATHAWSDYAQHRAIRKLEAEVAELRSRIEGQ